MLFTHYWVHKRALRYCKRHIGNPVLALSNFQNFESSVEMEKSVWL
jgi:hypothetical protein